MARCRRTCYRWPPAFRLREGRCSLSAAAARPLGQRNANYGYSRSTTSIDIELWNLSTSVRLAIPNAYLTFKPSWTGGQQKFVTLEAALPDLNPQSSTNGKWSRPRTDSHHVERVDSWWRGQIRETDSQPTAERSPR